MASFSTFGTGAVLFEKGNFVGGEDAEAPCVDFESPKPHLGIEVGWCFLGASGAFPECQFQDARWLSGEDVLISSEPEFLTFLHSLLVPNQVWAVVDGDGNVAVGLRALGASCQSSPSASPQFFSIGEAMNLIVNAGDLTVEALPGNPSGGGVAFPLGVDLGQ